MIICHLWQNANCVVADVPKSKARAMAAPTSVSTFGDLCLRGIIVPITLNVILNLFRHPSSSAQMTNEDLCRKSP